MRIFLLLIFTFEASAFSDDEEQAENQFNVEPITCIAALGKGRDSAEITGDQKLFRYLTDVQNDIYMSIPGFPKYSEIEAIHAKLGNNPIDLIIACIEKFE